MRYRRNSFNTQVPGQGIPRRWSNFRWKPAYTRGAEVVVIAAFGLVAALILPILSAVYGTLMLFILVFVAGLCNL